MLFDCLELQILLESCLKNKIPVLCVVAIIGTTEESAVDPIVDILEIRDRFKRKVRCINNPAFCGLARTTCSLLPLSFVGSC